MLSFTLPASCTIPHSYEGSAALSNEFLCVSLQDTTLKVPQLVTLRCTDLTTVWHKTLAARANPPAIANGIVYISTLDYNLRGYDLKTGEEWHLGRYDCYSQPIIANHTLYIVTKTIIYTHSNSGTYVARDPAAPVTFTLAQNYPNPFNANTRIRYELPHNCRARLAVYNLLGHELEVLVNENQTPGLHEVRLNAGELPSGIHFYRLMVTGKDGESLQLTRKLMLLK